MTVEHGAVERDTLARVGGVCIPRATLTQLYREREREREEREREGEGERGEE